MSEIEPQDVSVETQYHTRDTQYLFTPSVSDALRQLRNKGAVAACDNQIFRKHDLDYLDKLYVKDYVDYDIFPGQPPGLEGFKESFKWYLEAFPDLHTVVDFIIAEGDMVVVQGFFEGTQVGPFLGIPASGLQVTSRRCEATRFNDDGRTTERWGVGAELRFLQATKVIPRLEVSKERLANAQSVASLFSDEFFSNLNPAAIAELVERRARADSKGMLALFQLASAFEDVELKADAGGGGSAGPRTAVVRGDVVGVHTGPGLGHATRERTTAQLELSVRVADGKIVNIWADVGLGREARHRRGEPGEQSSS